MKTYYIGYMEGNNMKVKAKTKSKHFAESQKKYFERAYNKKFKIVCLNK